MWRVFAIGGPVQDVFQAKRAWAERRGLLIEVEDSSGLRGQGEVSPLFGVSTESLAQVQTVLPQSLPELFPDGGPADWLGPNSAYEAAVNRLPDFASLRFAVGTALWNLMAAREQTTCGTLWGGGGEASKLAALVSQRPPAVWDELDRHRSSGISTFKVKVGAPGKLTEELSFLRELKDELRPGERLRLDANRALKRFEDLAAFSESEAEYIEEPFSFDLLKQFVQCKRRSLPIALDESLRDQQDPMAQLEDAVSAWVIKPALLGEPLRTLRQAEEALARGARPVLSHLFDGAVARDVYLELAKAVDTRSRQYGQEGTAHGLASHAALAALTRAEDAAATSKPLRRLDVAEQVNLRSNAPAFVTPGGTISWRELHAAQQERVSALTTSEAVNPRSFAVLVARPDIETAISLAALTNLAAPAVLVDARLPSAARAELLAEIEVSVVLDGAEVSQQKPLRVAASFDAPLFVVFSSGSSGPPKPIGLSHNNIVTAAGLQSARLGLRSSDRWVWSLSPAHVGGLMIWARCLLTGAALAEGRPESLYPSIEATKASFASAVPAQLAREGRTAPPASLKTLLLGGAAAPWPLVQATRATGVAVFRSYGATETCAMAACESRSDAHRVDGPAVSAGSPLPGVEISIADDRIVVAGPTVGRVLGANEAVFRSHDRGSLDEQGNLQVLGRQDLVIISGGEKINPEHVEAALEAVPGIEAALVFGRPDPKWGAIVSACLVGQACSLARLREQLKDVLAPAAHPRSIRFCTGLPRTVAGKLKRQEAQRVWAEADEPPGQ